MTEMQAVLGREQLKTLDQQIKKRNIIANLYINRLKDYYQKFDVINVPNFKHQTCSSKKNLKSCDKCRHSYYRLNLFINIKKINQIKLIEELNKKKINCGVGACPEIYREKVFKKIKFYPKKRLVNAKLLGKSSIMFPINPNRSLVNIKSEIDSVKKILDSYL